MKSYQKSVLNSKVIMDAGNYDLIFDPLVWKAVKSGWKQLAARGENGNDVDKSEEFWTDDENKMVKYNVKALMDIHCSVAWKQFELIQDVRQQKMHGTFSRGILKE